VLLQTEWQRKTRNRVLRSLQKLGKELPAAIKKLRKTRDVELVAAIAFNVGRELQETGRDLQECARDLGHE